MINVAHDGNNGCTRLQVFRIVLLFLYKFFLLFNAYELHIASEFMRDELDDFRIEPLVDGNNDSKVQAGLYDFCYRNIEQAGELRYRNKLGDMYYFLSFIYILHSSRSLLSL